MPPKLPVGECATCDATEVKLRPNPFDNKKLQCEDCREVEIIGITALKERYGLKDKDLDGLKMVKEPQPEFTGRPDKRWYLVKEVEERVKVVEKEKAKQAKEKEKKAEEKRIAKETAEEEKRIAKEEREEKRRQREEEREAAAKKKEEDKAKGKRGVATKVKAPKKKDVADSDDKDFIVDDEEDCPSKSFESTPPTPTEDSSPKKYGKSTMGGSTPKKLIKGIFRSLKEDSEDQDSDIDIVPTPKKRGRPSKSATAKKNADLDDEEDFDTEESKPKKRGRPSKAAAPKNTDVEEEEDSEIEEPRPLKRGSKPTPYPKNKLDTSHDDEDDEDFRKYGITPNDDVQAARKKRTLSRTSRTEPDSPRYVRPRKVPEEDEDEEENNEYNSDDSLKTARKKRERRHRLPVGTSLPDPSRTIKKRAPLDESEAETPKRGRGRPSKSKA